MNKKLEEFKKFIKNKRIAVLGLGISNTPLIKYLLGLNADITAFDMAEESRLQNTLQQLKKYGKFDYFLGKNYLEYLKGFDIIFKTPKIRFDIPELEAERSRGALVTSEMEVFMELCPAQIIGITGSDGKTTTTTIIYNILKEAGYNCWLGGNIGTPLIDRIEEINEDDKVVLELSSFQLHTMKISPHISVITNISPNHLDVHKSMEEYVEAKKNIFLHQRKDDIVVLNYDNAITSILCKDAKGKVRYFSRVELPDSGVFIRNGTIIFKEDGNEREIIKTEDIILPGVHNIENYLAAIAATIDLACPKVIGKVASTFVGVEHRNEFVREVDGVKFYNDSIGSSPTRTIATLNSFDKKVILIAGGYDKHIPYDIIGETIINKTKALILLGQTAPLIEKAVMDAVIDYEKKNNSKPQLPIYKVDTLEEAVKKAYNIASRGDIVVLSPASASFDMFKNFEERGNKYKEIVNSL
ncbi:MAG TPA: UDP-N-acetylmuramoyl-L-alanine--D-glutamate ligase [Clostridiaceae bacterium]|nr:UDP-N-acetylmuramoyl-L-alanine--D-glutamate ligase [Clostridiaceae bacterium]